MIVDGCGWVRMGTGGTGGHKNKADRIKIDRAGDFCDAMAGEISPDMMFFGIRWKDTQIHADGYGLLRIGEVGCGSTGRQGNKAKGGRNARAGRVLQCISVDKKQTGKCERTKWEKKSKKHGNTTKRIALSNIIIISSPERKKNQTTATINRLNRGIKTGKICKTINTKCKRIKWGKKPNKKQQRHKTNCVTQHNNNFKPRTQKEPNDGDDWPLKSRKQHRQNLQNNQKMQMWEIWQKKTIK